MLLLESYLGFFSTIYNTPFKIFEMICTFISKYFKFYNFNFTFFDFLASFVDRTFASLVRKFSMSIGIICLVSLICLVGVDRVFPPPRKQWLNSFSIGEHGFLVMLGAEISASLPFLTLLATLLQFVGQLDLLRGHFDRGLKINSEMNYKQLRNQMQHQYICSCPLLQ